MSLKQNFVSIKLIAEMNNVDKVFLMGRAIIPN